MCYSIYLLHATVITAVFKLSRHLILPHALLVENYLIQVLVLGSTVLFVSGMYFHFVEQPCMRPDWPSRLWIYVTGRFGTRLRGLQSNQLGASPQG